MLFRKTLVVVLLAVGVPCTAQEVVSIKAYHAIGQLNDLDTLYQSGVDADSTRAAFGDRQEEFIQNYNAFYKDLNKYLFAHDFRWEDTTKCFNKLYFHPDGKVDKYLYSFRGSVSSEKQLLFEELATAFLKDYRFPMMNAIPFRQCGSSTFVPQASEPKTTPEP